MALSAATLLVAGLLPLRFDLRTFQVQARLDALGLPQGSDFLVLTADNSIDSAQICAFALPQWSFPRGSRQWLTLAERSQGVWSGGFLGVDPHGAFSRPSLLASGWEWTASDRPAWLSSFLDRAALVYDSAATRRAFEARLPELAGAQRVFVLGEEERPRLPLARPTIQFAPLVWWRLACLLGVCAVGACLMATTQSRSPALCVLGAMVGAVAALAALLASRYVLGQLMPVSWGSVAPVMWLAGTFLLWRRGERPQVSLPTRRASLAILAGVVAYAAIFTARLDFDGDTYTTYLQVARYYHWNGRHLPKDPGVAALVQGSVYPPGFSVLLALPLWITDQPAGTSLALGPRTSLFVLLYRWLVLGLYVALVVAVVAYVTALSGAVRGGLLSGLSVLFVVPMARGQHVAAETFLVPLLGVALVCVLAGSRFKQPSLSGAGLFLAGVLTLVKLDGLPFLLLLVLPTAIATARGWNPRRAARLALVLAAGLVPWFVWKLSGPGVNHAFTQAAPVDILRRAPSLAAHALKIVVKQDLWVPLLLALPVAVVARWGRWRAQLPALGVVAMSCAWVGVYALSNLGSVSHMETSLPRIMLGPGLAAWIYALDTLWQPGAPWVRSGGEPVSAAHAP